MDNLFADIRYALRQLRRTPGFVIITTLTLALAIGGSTSIFSVVHAVLLRPFPWPDSERLVALFHDYDGQPGTISPSNFMDWRSESRTIEAMSAFYTPSYTLTGRGDAVEIEAATVTGGFFDVLRAAPLHGRLLGATEEAPGRDQVVVLSHGLWQRSFGSDPAVVGTTIQLDGESYEVVGILQRGLEYPAGAELWTPLAFTPQELQSQRGAVYLEAIGRLAPGVELSQAHAELRTIQRRLEEAYPRANDGISAQVRDLRDALVGDVQQPLYVLLGSVGLVLLIACANVAGLLLSRSIPRARELVIRTAVGASRMRIVRQLLTESIMLALLGTAAGVLLASWATDVLVAIRPRDVPMLDQARIDRWVLLFSATLGVGTAVLFGLLPALQAAARLDLVGGLRDGGTVLSSRGGNRVRNGLVVGELALSLMLLVAAGMVMRSFTRLQQVDPGFEPARVITYSMSLPDARYPDPASRAAFVDRLLQANRAIPGVEESGIVFGLPMSDFSYAISVSTLDGRTVEQSANTPSMQVRLITPGYLETIGIRLREGRGVDASDRLGAPRVAMVNATAARVLWPDATPIGRHFELGTRFIRGGERAGGEVVGIVGDTRDNSLVGQPAPTVYLPFAQNPVGNLAVATRARGDAAALVPSLRQRLAELDASIAMDEVRTMEQRLGDSVARPRYYTVLLSIFAGVALALAVIGIYGVMAFAVSQRTREIGIRIALGARQSRVLREVLSRGATLAATGLGIGLVGAYYGSRWLEGLLYEIETFDAPTVAAVALILAAAAMFASYFPARRAARVDPIVALKSE